jgi:CheY-like chemotaxis protein
VKVPVVVAILLIEDEDLVRRGLEMAIESHGHQVWSAADGRQGMRVVAEQPVDVVITDIFMPEQEGLGTIMQLRALHPKVKIIAMTGGGMLSMMAGRSQGNFDSLAAAKRFGAAAVIRKPFRRRELLALVDAVLSPDGGEPLPLPSGD